MGLETSNESEASDVSTNTGLLNNQTVPPKESTKNLLAKVFIIGVLVLIGIIPFTLLWFGKIDVNGYKDLVLTLGTLFGGPLGIIVNNYFKEGGDQ